MLNGRRLRLTIPNLNPYSNPNPDNRLRRQVPGNAQIMDMVFTDGGDAGAGFVDNNKGLDYHVPVAGSGVPARRLKVVHVTVEMAPIAKARATAHALACPSPASARLTTFFSPTKRQAACVQHENVIATW